MQWVLEKALKKEIKHLTKIILKLYFSSPYHLHKGLNVEYLILKDHLVLWNSLKKYDHQKIVILPKASYDWMHLLQDFKTLSEYNSTMFKITSQLYFFGEKIMMRICQKNCPIFMQLICFCNSNTKKKSFRNILINFTLHCD